MHLHWPAITKLQVLEKLHIVPDYYVTELLIFFPFGKADLSDFCSVRSVGRGHCAYTVTLCCPWSTQARPAAQADLGKSLSFVLFGTWVKRKKEAAFGNEAWIQASFSDGL